MEITALSFQKNNPKRVNFFIDGKFLVGMSLEQIMEKKLKVGMQISKEERDDLVLDSLKETLLDNAFYYLAVRPRSEREVEMHLKNKVEKIKLKAGRIEINLELIDKQILAVIRKLKDLRQINDQEFIKWWFSQRQEFRPKSFRMIKFELLQKGVSKSLIDEVLEDQKPEIGDFKIAKELLQKRSGRWEKLDQKTQKEKIYQFLSTRGFSYETIKNVIDTKLQKE